MRICAPFAGIVRYHVADRSEVNEGQLIAGIEASRVETNISAPCDGTVTFIAAESSDVVGGDFIFKIEP